MPIKDGITQQLVYEGYIKCFYTYYWRADFDLKLNKAQMQAGPYLKSMFINLN